MNIDLIIAPEMSGSADALRAVSDRIRGDFFCLGADFISQVTLADLVTLHRSSTSDFTMMLCTPPKDSPMDDLEVEYIGLSDEGRVLMTVAAVEIEEMLTLSKHLFHRSTSFNLRKDLLDLGIYLMSHWVIQLVKSDSRFNSVKSDLVPYLIQRQFQTKEYLHEHMPAIQHRKRPLSIFNSWLTSTSQRKTDMKFQTLLDSTEEDSSDLLRCFAIVYEPPAVQSEHPFILNRITSIGGYLNLNK
jgi:NDP-sugar pyrophosphorylase family protein